MNLKLTPRSRATGNYGLIQDFQEEENYMCSIAGGGQKLGDCTRLFGCDILIVLLHYIKMYMTNQEILKDLDPRRVWELFAELTQIPRPSNKEEGVRFWLKDFADKNNLTYKQDEQGNLVIYKPEQNTNSKKTLLLQAHMDMVCQKEADLDFDFDKDSIRVRIENNFVYACDTTLGSDNGIGLCMILAILEQKSISHPKIEALFTMNEECGMFGVMGLDKSLISADYMINLDSEEEGTLWTSSAGGRNIFAEIPMNYINTNTYQVAYELKISGLRGGHSGVNIHENRVNGIELLAYILGLIQSKIGLSLVSIDGGNANNAIPRDTQAVLVFNRGFDLASIEKEIKYVNEQYINKESELSISITQTELPNQAIDQNTSRRFIKTLQSIHSGVYQMDETITNLVQTSFNLGIISTSQNKITISGMARSSDDFELKVLLSKLFSVLELYLETSFSFDFNLAKKQEIKTLEYNVELSEVTPGWKHDPQNPLIDIFQEAHQVVTGKKAELMAVHAGLECGMIKQYLPNCKIISFGPTIQNAHTPQEKVGITSVKDCYEVVLKAIQILGTQND